MKDYSVGIETKKQIIQASKKLFYEKGLHGTSYKEICLLANVNQGTLHYHFKSKYLLAKYIIDEYNEQLGEVINDLLEKEKSTNLYLKFVLNTYVCLYYKFKDENFNRFSSEIFKYQANENRVDTYRYYYQNLGLPQNMDINMSENQVTLIALLSVDISVPAFLAQNKDKYDWLRAAKELLSLYGRILCDNQNADYLEAIKEGEKLLKNYKFKEIKWY